MEEKKNISLEEVIDICNKFTSGEMSREELESWGNTIEIRLYLPIVEKTLCIDKIIDESSYSEDKHIKIAQLEMNKFWHILLQYTNIETEGHEDLFTIANYDLIYPVIGYWLKGLLRQDYDVVIDMLNQSINYSNILDMIATTEEVSQNNDYKKLAKIYKAILDILKDKEKLSALSDIMKYSTAEDVKNVVDTLQKEALNAIKETK